VWLKRGAGALKLTIVTCVLAAVGLMVQEVRHLCELHGLASERLGVLGQAPVGQDSGADAAPQDVRVDVILGCEAGSWSSRPRPGDYVLVHG